MQRFLNRQHSARKRKAKKYIENFKNICKIRDYIIECAKAQKLPTIDNTNTDESADEALSYIFNGIESSGLLGKALVIPDRRRNLSPRDRDPDKRYTRME